MQFVQPMNFDLLVDSYTYGHSRVAKIEEQNNSARKILVSLNHVVYFPAVTFNHVIYKTSQFLSHGIENPAEW